MRPPATPDAPSRGAGRGEDIRRVTQELLAEMGYDLLTVDAVAARAHASKATIYRRWASKAELVIDAVGCLAPLADFPDTGSLEGDLRAAFGHEDVVDDFRLDLMSGLVSAVGRDPDLAEVFRARFVAPRAACLRRIFERALDRGEIPPGRDLDVLVAVFPAMLSHRALIVGRPVDASYLRTVVDQVLLPLATAPLAGGR